MAGLNRGELLTPLMKSPRLSPYFLKNEAVPEAALRAARERREGDDHEDLLACYPIFRVCPFPSRPPPSRAMGRME